ncbi:sensor histidine kinase [Nocardia aurea]|uniref:sensor histidine kinase n=1 Tax=Nocardia aurea TaxID=2144174 RepID=UPI001E57F503|nr:ATP-binding protein [Nocardia aurea]
MFTAKLGIRGRILSIALVPSLTLLLLGVGMAGYLLADARKATNWAEEIDRNTTPGIEFAIQIQEERRLTMMQAGGDGRLAGAVLLQRAKVDEAMRVALSAGISIAGLNPEELNATVATARDLAGQLPIIRQRSDSAVLSADEAYSFFSRLVGVASGGVEIVARVSPTAETAAEEATAARLFHIAEAMSRSNAVAVAAVTSGSMSAEQLREFSHQTGHYRTEVGHIGPHLTTDEQATLRRLIDSDLWQRMTLAEDTLTDRGVVTPASGSSGKPTDTGRSEPLPLNIVDWQDAATKVSVALLDLWKSHHRYALRATKAEGDSAARNSMIGGATMLLISLAAFLIAARLSAQLIRRLRRLRADTLVLADEQLPRIATRLRDGQPVDPDTDVARLDYGTDEIGQVAAAFNRAQNAAVTAAIAEAKTREGVNAVFLNIAYRSQVVIHRQLEVLDQAEREQEDPTQLSLLFQLDHLATRERRNAENLIILGGGRPGRQWRNPIPLVDLVRSAVSETENYARVHITRLPDASVLGAAVADLIHLLAELVDNATSFSPPECTVEVSGNVVGKGIVVEITDQGLGMLSEDIERLNDTLSNSTDFSVTSLSADSRLGMFVVSRLAARHSVMVRLTESDYGGIRAIALLPSGIIASAATLGPPSPSIEAARALSGPEAPPVRRSPAVEPGRSPISSRESHAPEQTWETHSEPTGFSDPIHPDDGGRPLLPRRLRQTSLAPQLAQAPGDSAPTGDRRMPERPRTAEQARDLMSAIENGTRQGRRTQAIPERPEHYGNEGLL